MLSPFGCLYVFIFHWNVEVYYPLSSPAPCQMAAGGATPLTPERERFNLAGGLKGILAAARSRKTKREGGEVAL